MQVCVCGRVHIYVCVSFWVACFNLKYFPSKLWYLEPHHHHHCTEWLSLTYYWVPKTVARKVNSFKENHVFLFTYIISQVKCHMEKISDPMHNLKKKKRITTFTAVIMMHLSMGILCVLTVPRKSQYGMNPIKQQIRWKQMLCINHWYWR